MQNGKSEEFISKNENQKKKEQSFIFVWLSFIDIRSDKKD